ncbi:MAG: prepilin peptidase [Arachnia sp.]
MMWLVMLACSLSAALHLRWVVPRLREPVLEDNDPPPHYAMLAPLGHVGLLALAVITAAQVLRAVPPEHFGAWFGYLGAGAALVWVDLRTTWLPRTLSIICSAQVALGVGWVATVDWEAALGSVIGGLAAFALFHLVWRRSSAFGYGDVRLAGIVGAVGGLGGPEGWLLALFCGTLVGAAWGLVHAARRRHSQGPGYFPYGPALWLGPVLAIPLSGW